MRNGYEYTVQADAFDGETLDGDNVETLTFDTIGKAWNCVRAITAEQVVAWETANECDGVDIVILRDHIVDGCYEVGSEVVVGRRTWVGDKLYNEDSYRV